MRLFIVGLSSAALIVSLVAFVMSFAACDSNTKDQDNSPVQIDVLDVVEPQDVDSESEGEDVEGVDTLNLLDITEEEDQAQRASVSGDVEIIVFNTSGAVVYSQVWQEI